MGGAACRGGDILIQKINPLMRHSLECELHACLHLVEVAVARERVFVQVAVGVVKHHLRIFVESVVHADATEDVRIEGSVKLVAGEDGSDINHEVSGSFDVVELIDSGRSVYGTLSLPAIDIESCSEDRRELVAVRNRGWRRTAFAERTLADGVGGTSRNLQKPIWVKGLHLWVRHAQ